MQKKKEIKRFALEFKLTPPILPTFKAKLMCILKMQLIWEVGGEWSCITPISVVQLKLYFNIYNIKCFEDGYFSIIYNFFQDLS